LPSFANDRNEKYLFIHIKRISVDPGHIRHTVTDISSLKDTIADVGLLQPILVRQIERGYTVIDGARRLQALNELGVQELIIGRDVIVEASLDDADEKYRQLIANVQREDINDIEIGYAFVTLKEQYGYDYTGIAAMIGKSQHYVTAKVGLAKRLLPEIQALVIHDWENAKCIRDTFSGPADEYSEPYVMSVNVIQDIARLPGSQQKAAYEKIREKKMDKKEALRYLGAIKLAARGVPEGPPDRAAQAHRDLDRCLRKLDNDFEKLSVTVKAVDVDVIRAAYVIEKLIERLNALHTELKMGRPPLKAAITSE
jgi:ParB family transcriptional regulator, chromosome partitioning protein